VNTRARALRELVGMFVDDGALALAIVTAVVSAAMVAALVPQAPLAAGGVLVLGCLGALLLSVVRAGRR
jgi:uncharacterized membrane protein YdjX (TVP38/TMEM64 family)